MMPPQYLRSLFLVVVLACSQLWTMPLTAAEGESKGGAEEELIAEPVLQAESAILMDAKTGAVLYALNADKPLYPASITKIVTGIVALEAVTDLNSLVTVSKEARYEDGTRVFLAEGEQQTLENLIYGMLVNSGNDAATAIAEFIDGTKEKFAERMNTFVRDKAGATQSLFMNPSGLPDPLQVTTALDMAHIAQYAMKNEQFRTIVGTMKRPWAGAEWTSELINHNKLLGSYEGATGIKNGYTNAAGFTLVASAKRGEMELIGVILKAPTNNGIYADMRKLLDYGFQGFQLQKLFDSGQTYPQTAMMEAPSYVASEEIWAVIPQGEQPVIRVEPSGNVWVETSKGSTVAGKMTVIEPEAADEPALKNSKTISEETERQINLWLILVFFSWLIMNAFLVLIACLRYRRKRKYRSPEW
ncbi:D-alanyl-D-alanine carboxypeptidase family protein [Paenibacillus mendelii]|uniref:D-alanyl-D-alanine carboxypeptidase family protein n=1 Tax=Paenibacillus mendelii TaxID=206163 RepID=A0ABV6J377_9BACL|nr:D-alanyl-D-alanine carboxypeptidase family protein [Paenibacillus mendelii]MCQ6559442.1 D-alanyl-D-alanine carboxypeptidase [Paenibacillus mendelii]